MVEVFKTNIIKQKDANEISRRLLEHFPDYKINFDLEDCDNILRVESSNVELEIEEVIQLVSSFGFDIEPLTDDVISINFIQLSR